MVQQELQRLDQNENPVPKGRFKDEKRHLPAFFGKGTATAALRPLFLHQESSISNPFRGSNLFKEFLGAIEEAFPERRVFFAAQISEFLQLLTLLGIQFGRHLDDDAD